MDDLDVAGENLPSTATGHSGITLVLPSLRALKAANAGKKTKFAKQVNPDVEQRPKIPRPIKLKPLKEVLAKLIAQIKKKDDYAFFIHPVNLAQVPGYADVIQHPMDFGTMAAKVAKGKYRSLDDFTNDFRLVTTNAKKFNPPGSIYYAEADRLEAWGLDHIARVSAHVIEYETDWNIDVEQDEDGSTSLPVNVDDEVSTPRDVDGSMATGSRAPSTTPAPGLVPPPGQGKRGPRGPYKKHAQSALSESLDTEGRMPGAKDGVGAFPVGSDWAELMIALKIKGKRYKTKKERLRFEKEGPPYHADGSLDYTEMEDPFSILNVFVPEPPARPQLTPLYPSTSATTPMPTSATEGTQPGLQTSELRIHAPTTITVPPHRPTPVLSTLSNIATQSTAITSTTTSMPSPLRPPKTRRHWTIMRNVPSRARAKDKDGDTTTADDTKTAWKVPREAGPVDYGTFAALLGEFAASTAAGGAGNASIAAADYVHGSEQRLFATIRSTVVHRGVKRKTQDDEGKTHKGMGAEETFWTDARAEEAWDYVRDVVYGGVDGYAYVRSLAEFVAPSVYFADVRRAEDIDGDADEDGEEDSKEHCRDVALPLGVPLARYVEDNLVDTVTRGRHGWLRDVLLPVGARFGAGWLSSPSSCYGDVSPFQARLAALPRAARAMAAFRKWSGEQLDMAALIRAPEELAKESMLEGGPGGDGERAEIKRALAWSVEVIEALGRRLCGDEGFGDSEKASRSVVNVKEEEEEEAGVDVMDVDRTSGPEPDKSPDQSQPGPGLDDKTSEDLLLKRLRLNLLALAKRAPLDKIARLPVELVPEDIRGIVPTA